jgi:hypothetical protein
MTATGEDAAMLTFEKQRIGEGIYEAAAAVDVDNNGIIDIVHGEYWFEGPDFTERHKIANIRREMEDYYDDFSNYPLDVNGNGYPDIITGGWWGKSVSWRENPKTPGAEWTTHEIATVGNVERCSFYDVDGDGDMEVVPNTPGSPQVILKLKRDAAGKPAGGFDVHKIWDGPCGHGVGFGDLTGNGRGDIIQANGWLEAPEDPYAGEWKFHEDFSLGGASVPILVHDVNGDGRNDFIVGQGHDYGLHWYEQQVDGDGKRTWKKHVIDADRSQYHEMQLADIDNDGELELITGKRWRAHNGNDPGSDEPLGVYYFKINDGEFKRYTLDYGPVGQAAGVGIYLWVADVTGNGWKDIIAPGKDGLFLFRNLGKK